MVQAAMCPEFVFIPELSPSVYHFGSPRLLCDGVLVCLGMGPWRSWVGQAGQMIVETGAYSFGHGLAEMLHPVSHLGFAVST